MDQSEIFWLVVLGFVFLVGLWIFCRRRYQAQREANLDPNRPVRFTDDSATETTNMANTYDQESTLDSTQTSLLRGNTENMVLGALGKAKYLPFSEKKFNPKENSLQYSLNTNATPIFTSTNDSALNSNFLITGIKQLTFDNSFEWQILSSQSAAAGTAGGDAVASGLGASASAGAREVVGSLKRVDEGSFAAWSVSVGDREVEVKQGEDGWYCGEATILKTAVAADAEDSEEAAQAGVATGTSGAEDVTREWRINSNVAFGAGDDLNSWKSEDGAFAMSVVAKDNYSEWEIVDLGTVPIEERIAMIFAALFACKIRHYMTLQKD